MARVKSDFSSLKKFRKQLDHLRQDDLQRMYEACAKELAARLLAKVIRRTPVGKGAFEIERTDDGQTVKYKRGKKAGQLKLRRLTNGGTLRRGWTARTESEAAVGKGGGQNAVDYARGLRVERVGNLYQVTVSNPVSYASYVEYGHRQTPGRFVPQIGKRLKQSWVNGQFMLTLSVAELEREAPAIVERKIAQFLREVFGGAK